ncbi:MAG: hypothetical protein JO270_01835, partial [Acidobacteriaceae bacterium]|nr:hypothetical protein [Acidobacteriaceae bacterium]
MDPRIGEFAALLERAGFDVYHKNLADAFWLAPFLTVEGSAARSATEATAPVTKAPSDAHPAPRQPETPPGQIPPLDAAPVYPEQRFPSEGEIPAAAVDIPAGSALPAPLLLARALRPFSRRIDSPFATVLNEAGTADLSAHHHRLVLDFRSAKERWFNVALLIDDSPGMEVWTHTLDELKRVLETQGAFRDVRRWHLRWADGRARIVSDSGIQRPPEALVEPNRRRLILIATQGVSHIWYEPALYSALRCWSRTCQIAFVQMLPERLWEFTDLGDPDTVGWCSRAGIPNDEWSFMWPDWVEKPRDAVAAPIVTLTPESVKRWARSAMAIAKTDAPARTFILRTVPGDAIKVPHWTPRARISPEERIARFRHIASPQAFELATVLSAAPLTLPVMRLVQETVFGDRARQVDLAEFLLSGLIERITPETEEVAADQVLFDFFEDDMNQAGIRELLTRHLRVRDARMVLEAVSKHIQKNKDLVRRFPALVPCRDGQFRLPSWAAPFAEIGLDLLQQMGVVAPPESPVERYFRALVSGSARLEDLSNLLNQLGSQLDPPVRVTQADSELLHLSSGGIVQLMSPQFRSHRNEYPQVIETDLLAFHVFRRSARLSTSVESYWVADSYEEFRKQASDDLLQFARREEEGFTNFLRTVLAWREPSTTAAAVAPELVPTFVSHVMGDYSIRTRLLERLLELAPGLLLFSVVNGSESAEFTLPPIDKASLILLLVSKDYLASEGARAEMKFALDQYQAGSAVVIPIVARGCDWEQTPLGEMRVLPDSHVPLSEAESEEAALIEVVEEVVRIAADVFRGSADARRRWQEVQVDIYGPGTSLSGILIRDRFVLLPGALSPDLKNQNFRARVRGREFKVLRATTAFGKPLLYLDLSSIGQSGLDLALASRVGDWVHICSGNRAVPAYIADRHASTFHLCTLRGQPVDASGIVLDRDGRFLGIIESGTDGSSLATARRADAGSDESGAVLAIARRFPERALVRLSDDGTYGGVFVSAEGHVLTAARDPAAAPPLVSPVEQATVPGPVLATASQLSILGAAI